MMHQTDVGTPHKKIIPMNQNYIIQSIQLDGVAGIVPYVNHVQVVKDMMMLNHVVIIVILDSQVTIVMKLRGLRGRLMSHWVSCGILIEIRIMRLHFVLGKFILLFWLCVVFRFIWGVCRLGG